MRDSAQRSGPDDRYGTMARRRGFSRICGLDEAGRGPLAGPVVVAGVILDPANLPSGLNDSKALSQSARERVLNEIKQCADISVAVIEPPEVDQLNILWASLTGMSRCAETLGADFALIDGNTFPKDLPCDGETIVKGDAKSVEIAAASIVAKVTRDRLMIEADKRFPGYGFAQHKGYPTKAHMDALERLGPCPIHRRSFAPVQRAFQLI